MTRRAGGSTFCIEHGISRKSFYELRKTATPAARWASRRSPASLYKPTTQGKNERFHQSLFRYLDKQSLGATLAQLQA